MVSFFSISRHSLFEVDDLTRFPSQDPSSAESQQAYYISTSSLPKVRALTSSDITAKTHSIYDVVLPMPGFAVTYPGGELGEVYKRVIREDGIDPEKMWRKQKEYSLVSSRLPRLI